MKKISLLLLAISIFLLFSTQAMAQDEKKSNASFGIAGSTSVYNMWERKKGFNYQKFNYSLGYGGGLYFEKMFNNTLGIQSGLILKYGEFDMRSQYFYYYPTSKIIMKVWHVNVPVDMVVSLNTKPFSFLFLFGVDFLYFVHSRMYIDVKLPSYRENVETDNYTASFHFGVSAGIQLKFRVSHYTDLFFGFKATLYITQLIANETDISHLYKGTATVGVLFRTDLFPAPVK